ncbi:MAG: sporulation protein YabP [Oscillospiraceae bacterium]|nr:sporulation protein YabP [Oscillospiraceae bacterium]MDD7354055.1 sporulation protein YabP [Oscillospiraceae bacterium]MDY3938186.1 sporulation protein YabP [Oscillospiraceae bacterium]
MNEENKIKFPHNVFLEDRKKLSVSGVNDIGSFDDETIVAYTDMGELTVRGEGLHINKMSVDTGELSVEGEISALIYSENENPKKNGGFFARLFG